MDDVVTHHPPVSAPELASWYRAADVVVMPSYSESFGLVALEAQACGTPVVATRVGGLSRAVRDGRTGLLVDGHQAGDWADALEALYDDPATRAGHGHAPPRSTRQDFGWQRTAAITLESYHAAAEPVFGTCHPGGPRALNRPGSGPEPASGTDTRCHRPSTRAEETMLTGQPPEHVRRATWKSPSRP